METEAFFQEKVYLTPKDLRNDIQSVDDILVQKLRERLEQRCSPHGYVLPGTLEILTRSTGMVDSGRFSGDWAFLVKARGRVLHPPEGTVVEVEILKFNKMGIYAVYENAIRLMIPRDLHLGDEEFDSLKVGDRIKVEIQKSRFQLRDPFIVSVGIFRGGSGAPTKIMPEANEANEANQALEEANADASGDEEETKEGDDEGETKESEGDAEASGAEEEEEEEAKEE
jgi:DNA-directed RNA polymerase subunit E'/Rpb7